LILSREEREALLLNWGASFHDIVESVRSNLKIKNQRRQTVTNLGKIERIEEAFESATRKLKSALMLRRSTGNKLKRLQEQANLAQSALTSLKIAEDRALSEIRGTSQLEMAEEAEGQDDFNSYPISQYGPTSAEDTEVRDSQIILPEEEDQISRRYSLPGKYSLPGNSTTPSETEIERFYQELELEMFGDEELPSMVGQTLEVPLKNGDRNASRNGMDFRSEECSVNSGMTDRFSRDGLDDELLEKEENQSMISQNLLEETYIESSTFDHSPHGQGEQDVNRYYYSSKPKQPLHMDQPRSENLSTWNQINPFGYRSKMNIRSGVIDYKQPHQSQHQTIPLHAGMPMFEDCALLGGKNDNTFYRERRTRRSSRKNDLNSGPKVQFIRPPIHLSPSHWMDSSDPRTIPSQGHDTITICEEDFDDGGQIYQQGSHNFSTNSLPSSFYRFS